MTNEHLSYESIKKLKLMSRWLILNVKPI